VKARRAHQWPEDAESARRIQGKVRERAERCAPVRIRPRDGLLVAGADVAYGQDGRAVGGVVVLRLPGLERVEESFSEGNARFPYVPGLLAFREGPLLLEAFAKLRRRPDVALFDAAGRAHPERFGLATHLGYLLDLPTIGCAKTWLAGRHSAAGPRAGDAATLEEGGEAIGAVLRTRDGIRPVFVSPGFATSLEDSLAITMACVGTARIPEPVRQADIGARAALRSAR